MLQSFCEVTEAFGRKQVFIPFCSTAFRRAVKAPLISIGNLHGWRAMAWHYHSVPDSIGSSLHNTNSAPENAFTSIAASISDCSLF